MKTKPQFYDDDIGRLVPFRLLENYQAAHKDIAIKKKVESEFMKAQTLTRARGILWGFKSKGVKPKKDND